MPLETVAVTQRELPLLFSLVREDFPELTQESWATYAMPYVDESIHGGMSGMVAARTTALNQFRGLFLYSVETTLRHPRTLVVPHAVLPQALGSDVVADMFLGCWQQIAARHGCGQLQLNLSQVMLDKVLTQFGDAASVETFCVCMTTAPSRPRQPRPRSGQIVNLH